ncbi:Hypothetical protein, putative, partial [Bodo saltans]
PQHRGAPPLKCPAINDRGTATHFLVHPYGYFIPEANLMFVDHFHRDHHQASSPGGRGGVPPSTLHTASPHPFLWDWHIVLPSVSPGGDAAGVTYPRIEVLFAVEDEVWYTLSLRYSRFAWTVRRTGQNTQRTMEILAAGGALPFYPYFNRCEERSPLVYDKNYSSRRDGVRCLWQLPLDTFHATLGLPGVRHIVHHDDVPPVEESSSLIHRLLRQLQTDEDAAAVELHHLPLTLPHKEGTNNETNSLCRCTQSNSTLTGLPCRCTIHPNNNNNTQPPRPAGLMTTTTQNDNACECFSRFLFLKRARVNVKQVGTVDWVGDNVLSLTSESFFFCRPISRSDDAHGGNTRGSKTNSTRLPTDFFFAAQSAGATTRTVAKHAAAQHINETAHRAVQQSLQDFTQAHLTCGAGMASLLRIIRYEEPRRVLHLVNHNDVTTGNNGVCGLAELGISYARNVADGIEHWTQEEEDAEEMSMPRLNSNRGDVPAGSSNNVTFLPSSKTGWTMESFLRWKSTERIRHAYAYGYFYAHRHAPPPLAPVLGLNMTTPHDVCLTMLRGFDLIIFGGVIPGPRRVPCYDAIIQLLERPPRSTVSTAAHNDPPFSPEQENRLVRFVVIDESDRPVSDDGAYHELVKNGAWVFSVNAPAPCAP